MLIDCSCHSSDIKWKRKYTTSSDRTLLQSNRKIVETHIMILGLVLAHLCNRLIENKSKESLKVPQG